LHKIQDLTLMYLPDNRDEAEKAELLITGEKRLANGHYGAEVIYNLFGLLSWNNFNKLKIFILPELHILEQRKTNKTCSLIIKFHYFSKTQ
jgi:hypothetical protein